jgi:hypothetical protein
MSTRRILARFIATAGCVIGTILLVALCAAQERKSQRASDSLLTFLQKYLAESGSGPDRTTRFSSVLVKVGAAKQEIVVYVAGRDWCGSGGCTLLVLEPNNSSYKVIGRTPIVRLPVRLLESVTNGRPDISVWVQGGGIQTGYEALLPFNGEKYPTNPSVPPARPLTRKVAGEVIIPKADKGVPLYN